MVAVHAVKLAAEKAKSLEAVKMAHALEDLELPPEVALQPGKIAYRAGDHQLMSDIFVGEVHPPGGQSRTICSRSPSWCPARRRPDPVADTGCHMTFPSGLTGETDRIGTLPPRGGVSPCTATGERRMLQLVLFNVTNGLIIGAFYVLMALGLSLIINLSNVINFAHGNFLAIGGYIAFVLTPYIGFWGALLVSPFLTAISGY